MKETTEIQWTPVALATTHKSKANNSAKQIRITTATAKNTGKEMAKGIVIGYEIIADSALMPGDNLRLYASAGIFKLQAEKESDYTVKLARSSSAKHRGKPYNGDETMYLNSVALARALHRLGKCLVYDARVDDSGAIVFWPHTTENN